MKPIKAIALSPAFFARHHFAVTGPNGQALGWFASLYCAANTAIHEWKMSERKLVATIIDTEAGIAYDFAQYKALELRDMETVDFSRDPVMPPIRRVSLPEQVTGVEEWPGVDDAGDGDEQEAVN